MPTWTSVCDLADKYDAMVLVDESHASGFIGKTGRGTIEHCGVMDRVDVVTSTLGKALGGASGGFTAARKEIVDLLRQRSRPYLFSNTVAPPIVSATLACMDLLSGSTELRDTLEANTMRFREGMTAAGFDIRPGVHPIVPISSRRAPVDGDGRRDARQGHLRDRLQLPRRPKGAARIRVQLSAAHSNDDIDKAIAAFTEVGKDLGVLQTA